MPNDTPQTKESLPLPAPPDTALDLARLQKRLETLNNSLDAALSTIERGLAAFDSEQRLIRCNTRCAELLVLSERLKRPGTSFSEIARHLEAQVLDRAESDKSTQQRNWIEDRSAALARGETFTCTQRFRDGRTVRMTSQPLTDGGSLDTQEYASDRRRPEHTIQWLADYDPLTEVANSMYFSQELENALRQLTVGTAFALHWIDLDRFAEINGKFGRPLGDAVLRNVAERLVKCVRTHDLVARLGGDEFAIIQPGVKSREEAEQLTKRLLHAINKPFHVLGHEISTSASVGVVLAPEHGTNSLELIKNVYIALYAAKAAGRDTHRLFEERPGQHGRELMKDEFIATLGHELRTPLTSIMGSLALLATGAAGALPEPAARLINVTNVNCQRLAGIISEILDIEELESGKTEFDVKPIDVGALIEPEIAAVEGFAQHFGVRIRFERGIADGMVQADSNRLAQVLNNLLSNAVKYSPRGTEVIVGIENRGGTVRISVRDHGRGIPQEFKDRIFEKFVRADASDARQRGGVGLGLSIVKDIVERLGGEVGFEPAPGGGTIFYVILPHYERLNDTGAIRHDEAGGSA